MKFKRILSATLLASLCINANLYANNVTISGTIPGSVQLSTGSKVKSLAWAVQKKPIVFQRVVLSNEAQKYLAANVTQQQSANVSLSAMSTSPSSAFVGMNGVPVLDQGQHGTCVTFAVLGAIDATIDDAKPNKSYDHYSELCSLELGTTLEKESPLDSNGEHTYPSGWDGSWSTFVFDQSQKHGLITKDYQRNKGCAGVYAYPSYSEADHGKAMTAKVYDAASEKVIPPISFKVLMHSDDAFTSRADTEKLLTNVKKALNNKHRVTFGTLLDVNYGMNGAVGSYKASYDTWLLTPEIAKDAKNNNIEAGHEMIIIGYDDNAKVKGPDNVMHKGVLTLRNSWGSFAGDNGNYYMTYDHFKALVLEAVEVIPNK